MTDHIEMATVGVKDLEFSTRTARLLEREGITNLNALMRLRKNEVMRWGGAGRKTWLEISDLQDRYRPDPKREMDNARLELANLILRANCIMDFYPETFRAFVTVEGRIHIYERVA